jgi:hypothetical protein
MGAAHPQYLRVSGYYTPPPPTEPEMDSEPQPGAEGQAEPQPEEPTYDEPAPEPEVELEAPRRPDDLRSVAPPRPRRGRGGPPPLGPTPAAACVANGASGIGRVTKAEIAGASAGDLRMAR